MAKNSKNTQEDILVGDLKRTLNKRVVAISNHGELIFEDGTSIDCHPYETYVDTVDLKTLKREHLAHYSSGLFD